MPGFKISSHSSQPGKLSPSSSSLPTFSSSTAVCLPPPCRLLSAAPVGHRLSVTRPPTAESQSDQLSLLGTVPQYVAC
ncbi:hypothetical protein C8R44DRAFT_826040 [Mycena epipterygia]|nr:hypothetical protein C8R44DRAFT_826787 [Mycena epipterygia]KAJ7076608.1 hypothetical protein C8R44DRAFT_826751 [Mycena epipterygia]KAJ7077583.1 hypothetical protein C8R44DRAFT_826040 [Mycena epipterygia]